MYYVLSDAGHIIAIFQELREDVLEDFDAETREILRKNFEENMKGTIPFESLPADFDWDHIDRYSVDENHTIVDNGWEEPPSPPSIDDRVTTVENVLAAMMEGISDA